MDPLETRSLRSVTVTGWPRVVHWSDAQMIIRGGSIEAWLEGRRLLSVEDPEVPLDEGYIGFSAGFGTYVAMLGLDDVVVCGLSPES